MTAVREPQQARDSPTSYASGTATITGTVVTDDDSGKPLRNAIVSISGRVGPVREVALTDDEGRFAIANLPSGDFAVIAARPGYVDASYFAHKGSSRAATSVVTLAEGERQVVTLYLAHGAVLTGRILDAVGRPQRAVQVQSMPIKTLGGQRVGNPLPTGSRAYGVTDDTGSYRLYGLPPGDYVISATVSSQVEARAATAAEIQWAQGLAQRPVQPGPAPPAPATSAVFGYAPVFYPGGTDLSAATVVTLGKGEERQGIDFSLQPVPLARIEGALVDASARPVPGVEVSLLSSQPGPPLVLNQTGIPASRTDSAGVFRFSRVLPGTYMLVATEPAASAGLETAPGAVGAWARESIAVSGTDVLGVSLRLQPGLSVSGRVVLEGDSAPEWRQLLLRLPPSSGSVSTARVSTARATADGGFILRDLMPGSYRLLVEVQPPESSPGSRTPDLRWFTKSVVAGGIDTLDSALEISTTDVSNVVVTLTDHPSELSGTLAGAKSRAVSDYRVAVFPMDRNFWTSPRRVRTGAVDEKGAYIIIGLPPGEYYLAALGDLDFRQLSDVAFLESLIPTSIKITLADGEKKKQDLKLSGGSPD